MRRRPADAALAVVGAGLVLAAAGVVAWIGWFSYRSSTGGAALLRREDRSIAKASAAPPVGSSTSGADACPTGRGHAGILAIPALGLVAPVVQGTGDPELADAVGHLPSSVWPGQAGTAVLAAHDVTWFHDLPALRPGDVVEYEQSCRAVAFRVVRVSVVRAGTPVLDRPYRLALVTCWPLDALWYTGTRFLVVADEMGGSRAPLGPLSRTRVPRASPPPPLAVPEALAPLDSLAANPTPLGTLEVSGSPERRFSESPSPLEDAAAAQDLWFAAQRAALADDAAWWADIAPGVPIQAVSAFEGARIVGFPSPLDTVLLVDGTRLAGARLSVAVELEGGPSPGRHEVSVEEGIVGGRLTVVGVAVSP
jgi:sortase A